MSLRSADGGRALSLACALSAAGCTTLLGIDGDYAMSSPDEGGVADGAVDARDSTAADDVAPDDATLDALDAEASLEAASDAPSDGRPTDLGVSCGNMVCPVGNGLACCLTLTNGGDQCVDQSKRCNGDLLACDDPADCAAGETCCLSMTTNNTYASICAAQCSHNSSLMCDPNVAGSCPGGRMCAPTASPEPLGYYVCM